MVIDPAHFGARCKLADGHDGPHQMELGRDEKIANCPTPEYHATHRYCPACPWTEADSMTAAEIAKQKAEGIRNTCADLHNLGVPFDVLEPILRHAERVEAEPNG